MWCEKISAIFVRENWKLLAGEPLRRLVANGDLVCYLPYSLLTLAPSNTKFNHQNINVNDKKESYYFIIFYPYFCPLTDY